MVKKRFIIKFAALKGMKYWFECDTCRTGWMSLGLVESDAALISITQKFINQHLTHDYTLRFKSKVT